MTPRTVRNWLRAEGGPRPRAVGRPAYPAAVRRQVLRIVLRLWREMPARAGWRTVLAAAGGMLPARLVQEALRRIKRIFAARAARGRARRRVSVRVSAVNVLWHLDATHLGRTADGEAVHAQAVRDAAAPTVHAATVGREPTAADAVRVLVGAILAAGAAPLVLATDNGAAYTSERFTDALAALGIVHLRNLPRTPQHNARIERVFRDWKEDEDLGRGALLADVGDAAARVMRALANQEHLAALRSRPAPLTLMYTPERRDRFYEEVCRRVRGAVQCARTARARRLAEREAIHAELEDHGLIERTRGGAPLAARKVEGIT